MTNLNYIVFFILIIVASVYALFIKNEEKPSKGDIVSVDYSTAEGKIFNKFYSQSLSIISNYNLEISPAMILSVIEKESYLNFLYKNNKDVLGDDNKSVGYMQVSNPAVIDTNRFYNKTFKFQDLFNEDINLLVGSLYLNICYLSAIKLNSSNSVWLAFKKYNGGNDETDFSINAMAVSYANTAFKYYKKFSELT